MGRLTLNVLLSFAQYERELAGERIRDKFLASRKRGMLLRLTLLAPDVLERILDGRPTVGLAQFLKPFPVEWERRRQQFSS
jgi:DNA invertase Pin-like site-specific DNA recombinase